MENSESKNVVALIQARMSSTRLPGKVLMNLAGKPVLQHVVERVECASKIGKVVIATSTESGDDPIEEFASELEVECFRGSESDVLDRFWQAAQKYQADMVVRVTADCPLVAPEIADMLIDVLIKEDLEYAWIPITKTAVGLPSEVMTISALERTWRQATNPEAREHVTVFIQKHQEHYRTKWLPMPPHLNRPEYDLSLDTPQDFELLTKIYNKFYREGEIIKLEDVMEFLDKK